MLLESWNDILDDEVADYSYIDYEEDLGLYDATESGDVSSDPLQAQDDGRDTEDVQAKPNATAKRKAGPDSDEVAGSQKKARTDTGEQEVMQSDTTDTTTEPREYLDSDQKNYLAKELMALQELKYATSFVSSQRPISSRDSAGPMDLNTVMAKLLEDKYPSGQTFQDDVKLVVQSVALDNYSKKADVDNGKSVLARVDKFLKKLPKSKTYEGSKGSSAVVKTKTFHPGPTEAQEREKKYALEQVEAYRSGKQSNQGRTIKNLVASKIAEERAKSAKATEKKQRIAGLMRSLLETKQNDKKSADEVEFSGVKGSGESEDDVVASDLLGEEESEDDEINDDPLDDNIEDEEDREVEDVERDPTNKDADRGKVNKSYVEHLSELSTALPTQQHLAALDLSATTGPNFVGRAASVIRGCKFGQYHKKTNGYTSNDVLLPAADSRNRKHCSHYHLADLAQGEIMYMTGNHLIWKDLVADEFLSYTKSPFFFVVHGLRRHHEAQGDVTIQFLDRRMAETRDGTPAKFYVALDIYTAFDVPKWDGWGDSNNIKLHPRKFTQEYLTHGPVLTPNTIFKQASVKKLIEDGLYEIFPEFQAPEDHKRAGLYTLQVVYRKIGYPPAPHAAATNADGSQTTTDSCISATVDTGSSVPSSSDISSSAPGASAAETSDFRKTKTKARKVAPPIYSYDNCARQTAMTEKLLETVRKVTLNFRVIPDSVDASTIEPPLHAFICFLTFEKRLKADPVFLEWIRKRYTGKAFTLFISVPQYANKMI